MSVVVKIRVRYEVERTMGCDLAVDVTAPAAGETAGSLVGVADGVGMKVEVVVKIFVDELPPTMTTACEVGEADEADWDSEPSAGDRVGDEGGAEDVTGTQTVLAGKVAVL